MNAPAYPAARAAAAAVADAFARLHGAPAEGDAPAPGPLPDAEAVEALVDASFWASLRREEGRSPRISLALLPPDRAPVRLSFGRPIPLRPTALVRLAPAVERPGIHLGVWPDGGALRVWGATRQLPPLTFVLEVVQPGLMVVKHSRPDPSAKFGNVAVLDGDRVKVVDEHADLFPGGHDGGPLAAVLVRLAASMRAHAHGGTLLVVPHGSDAWRASVLDPPRYPLDPAFVWLAEAVRRAPAAADPPAAREALRLAIDGVAGLTAVDGVTVVTDRGDVLAFGAMIQRAEGCAAVGEVRVTEPVVGDVARVRPVEALGGARHRSAAQFAHDQRDALALVASMDGHFSALAWAPAEGRVHARRVEVLLL